MNMPQLDRVDRRILEELQGNARLSSADLAERVSLSTSPCWRRVKRLEEEGVIRAYQARVDPAKLGYQLMAVAEDLQAYGVFAETRINGLPSVKEVYTSFVMREVKAPGMVPMPG
jgi:Lrp/AsnC family leucine-responsive transcriptional regulator